MQLNPPPVHVALNIGDHVVAIGLYSRVHGTGKVIAIRQGLAAVKFASGHVDEFTPLQLRKVAA